MKITTIAVWTPEPGGKSKTKEATMSVAAAELKDAETAAIHLGHVATEAMDAARKDGAVLEQITLVTHLQAE